MVEREKQLWLSSELYTTHTYTSMHAYMYACTDIKVEQWDYIFRRDTASDCHLNQLSQGEGGHLKTWGNTSLFSHAVFIKLIYFITYHVFSSQKLI